jgi:ATP-binding cassette subfamily F protein 3
MKFVQTLLNLNTKSLRVSSERVRRSLLYIAGSIALISLLIIVDSFFSDYRGNFDNYVRLRDEHTKNAMREYQAYEGKRAHMMEFINKFRANAKRATMVQSRIKTVEKMDVEAPPPVKIDPVWRFSIPSSDPLGRPIISVDDVSFDYNPVREDGTKMKENAFLLQKVNFGVDLASRIAIMGANGQGKTTLLNLIMGKIRPINGSVTINSGLRIGASLV